MSRAKAAFFLSCLALLVCSGCGGANQAKLRNDLKATGLAYHGFQEDNKKAPSNWDELIAYAEKANLFPDGIKRVRDAGYTMTWDVKLSELKEPASSTVLAKPPGTGPTLMMDGSVK
jgi:hypothetical protein